MEEYDYYYDCAHGPNQIICSYCDECVVCDEEDMKEAHYCAACGNCNWKCEFEGGCAG